jgi:hypothetical protein
VNKELWTTIDYYDDVLNAHRHHSPSDLDAMMKYVASLGTRRVQWVLDTIWTFYDDDAPGGFDLLEAACSSAHRHGMRFHVIFKPFEGALAGANGVLPHGLELSRDGAAPADRFGLIHICRPQVAEHPEWSLARLASDAVDPGGRIAAIHLVKDDDAPCPFAPGDLSIWTSARNGGYTKYAGPLQVSDDLDRRSCRIVTLSDLQLPADTRFVMIRRESGSHPFRNAVEQIIELVNERGDLIPGTPALRRVDGQKAYEHFKWCVDLQMTRFARTSIARAIVQDRERFLQLCDGMSRFDAGWEDASLDAGSDIVMARGKPRHRLGNLHPIYSEVRQDWLRHVQFCIDRGADSVNMRIDNHNSAYEPYCFGFNTPVVERMSHAGHRAEAARINGNAYTQFLREAASLLHEAGRTLGVHVHATMFHHDDRAANAYTLPRNFDWQWQSWISEFADYVEYRGAACLRPENQRAVADRVGFAAREAGVPMIYQSMRGPMVHFDGPHHALAQEMDWVRAHPDVAAYNLYEVADFSRMDPQRGFEGSRAVAELVDQHWHRVMAAPTNPTEPAALDGRASCR